MENKIEIFKNEELGEVRSLIINGEPYFVAKDVAEILGYSETNALTKRLDDDEFISDKLEGMNMKSILLNESGLYNAIFGSQLEKAKQFRKWVFKEVLPSIRKHGLYITEELLRDKEKLQNELDKIYNNYYELEHKNTDLEFDVKHLQAEKDEIKEDNIRMCKERESAFKLSLKTHEKETYLPNLTIQAIRHYINNNKDVILDKDEEGFYIKLSLLIGELKKLILNKNDRLYVLCSLGINISDRVTFIPKKFMNEDYEVTGISYL